MGIWGIQAFYGNLKKKKTTERFELPHNRFCVFFYNSNICEVMSGKKFTKRSNFIVNNQEVLSSKPKISMTWSVILCGTTENSGWSSQLLRLFILDGHTHHWKVLSRSCWIVARRLGGGGGGGAETLSLKGKKPSEIIGRLTRKEGRASDAVFPPKNVDKNVALDVFSPALHFYFVFPEWSWWLFLRYMTFYWFLVDHVDFRLPRSLRSHYLVLTDPVIPTDLKFRSLSSILESDDKCNPESFCKSPLFALEHSGLVLFLTEMNRALFSAQPSGFWARALYTCHTSILFSFWALFGSNYTDVGNLWVPPGPTLQAALMEI